MMTLITGGSKCGKSHFAESLFSGFSGERFYIATMKPFGEEAFAAIERHRKMRAGKGFFTIEQYTDLEKAEISENSAVLVECAANLCANEMFSEDEIIYPVDKIISSFIKINEKAEMLVVVTNETGCDGIEYGEGTMMYIKALSEMNRRLVAMSDNAVEMVYGIPLFLKGNLNENN